MWLFGGGSEDDTREEVACKEDLKAEADELQAKLNALRRAPGSALMEALPEEQREAVRDTRFGSGCDGEGENAVSSEALAEAAVHYDLADDRVESPKHSDLIAMYDFSGFKTPCTEVSPPETPSPVPARQPMQKLSKKARLRAERKAELERLQALETTLRARSEELEIHMENQERKLAAATRSVAKTRKQAAQLTAQVGLQDIKGSKNSKEVEQLRLILAEREGQLQDALDECDHALNVNTRNEGTGDEGETVQQPQEAPTLSPEDEESLQQLLRITEELTDALEVSRAGEDELKRELDTTLADLQREEERASECRKRMEEAKEAKDAEVASLLARLKEKEQTLAAERARCIALEVGTTPPKVVEPEGEPVGKESVDLLPKVDRSDPEVLAAERAALAAAEASKLHGWSASRAGATAAKVAGHLTNVANGGLLRKLHTPRTQARRAAPFPPKRPESKSGATDELRIAKRQDVALPNNLEDANYDAPKATDRNLDWNLEPIEV